MTDHTELRDAMLRSVAAARNVPFAGHKDSKIVDALIAGPLAPLLDTPDIVRGLLAQIDRLHAELRLADPERRRLQAIGAWVAQCVILPYCDGSASGVGLPHQGMDIVLSAADLLSDALAAGESAASGDGAR